MRRKFSLKYSQIRAVVEEFTEQFEIAIVSVTTVETALNLAERYQYSYFDSLIEISDAAYIEITQLQPYLLVVFTKGKDNAKNTRILPFISQAFIAKFSEFSNNS